MLVFLLSSRKGWAETVKKRRPLGWLSDDCYQLPERRDQKRGRRNGCLKEGFFLLGNGLVLETEGILMAGKKGSFLALPFRSEGGGAAE